MGSRKDVSELSHLHVEIFSNSIGHQTSPSPIMSAMEVAATTESPVKKVEDLKKTEGTPATENGINGDIKGPTAATENGTNGDTKSPAKEDDKQDDLKKAMAKLAAGKRALLVQDSNDAVENLAEACELLGKVYGETGKEMGDSYFLYGKALLEEARKEAGVIDNAFDGVEVASEDEAEDSSFVEGPKLSKEEEEKIAEQVDEALTKNYEEGEAAKKAAAEKEKKETKEETEKEGEPEPKKESEENSEEDEEEEEAGEDETPAQEVDGAGPSTANGEAGAENVKDNESIGSNESGTSETKDSTDKNAIEKEEEEDPSNLQLAWEILELAKSCFSKHADSLPADSETRMEVESKLSETYQTLGEVSIENENYPQAIEDLTMCLRRRQDLLPEDSRCIAETHYQLGVALGFNAQFEEAEGALSDAISVLEKRIGFLKEGKASLEASKAKDAFYTAEKEVKEIEGIIPEIKEKIADTQDMAKETIKKIGDKRLNMIAEASSATENGDTLGGSGTSPKATTILTVKKRKTTDEAQTNGDAKKPHLENGVSTTSSAQ